MNSIGGARGVMRSDFINYCSIGGSIGAMRSDFSYYYCKVPSSTTMTYEGILNAAYFKLNSKIKR